MAKSNRTRSARERRQKQQRQNQQRLILVGVVLVAIVAVALLIVSNQPTDAFVAEDIGSRYEGLETSYSSEGYPRLGDPDAPVVVEEFASFSCPGCASFHDTSFPQLLPRVELGQVLFTYIPLQTGSVPNAEGSARAALCAGQQGQFWEMHDVLFDWHTRYGNGAYTQARLLAGVTALGMDSGAFSSCFNSDAITSTLNAAQNEGVASTPTIRVNGVDAGLTIDEIQTAIDAGIPPGWSPNRDTNETPSDSTVEEPQAESTEEASNAELTESDLEGQSSNDEPTESDVEGQSSNDEPTESDVEGQSSNDEPTESDVEGQSSNSELTESEVEAQSGNNELTESDVATPASNDEPTESDVEGQSGG